LITIIANIRIAKLNINSANFSASVVGASASAVVITTNIGQPSLLGFKIAAAINSEKAAINEKLVFSIYNAITKTHGMFRMDRFVSIFNFD